MLLCEVNNLLRDDDAFWTGNLQKSCRRDHGRSDKGDGSTLALDGADENLAEVDGYSRQR